jgi:hypothetical protein
VAALPTATPTSTKTKTSTPIPTGTNTATATYTSTFTPTSTPYLSPTPTPKPILIELQRHAGCGADEIYLCLTGFGYPQFKLYEDGQLIHKSGGYLVETYLTEAEIQELFADIEATGFFDIEFKIGLPWENGVYDMPEELEYGEGGWGTSLQINDVSIGTIPSLSEYLVQPVSDTISVIGEFEPSGESKPFIPERLFMYMFDVNDDIPELAHYSRPVSGEWPVDIFPIQEKTLISFEQDQIARLVELGLFSSFPDLKVFTSNGKEYFVVACPSFWW